MTTQDLLARLMTLSQINQHQTQIIIDMNARCAALEDVLAMQRLQMEGLERRIDGHRAAHGAWLLANEEADECPNSPQ